MSVLIALIGISALIFLHELGHFLAARFSGMHVERFSIGLGPTVLCKKAFGTEWQVGLIPLGGYVLIAGMDAAAPTLAAPTPAAPQFKRYVDAPLFQRAGVIAAGPFANFLVAAFLLALGALTFGHRELLPGPPTLEDVTPAGAAAKAGLQSGDKLLSVEGQPIDSWPSFVAQIRKNPETALAVVFERHDARTQTTLIPMSVNGMGQIGASPMMFTHVMGYVDALKTGAGATASLCAQQGRALLQALTGRGGGQLAGLPAIVRTLSSEAKLSFGRLLESLAYLSVGLGLINLAPFPALDGGRLVFLGIEAIRRRPASARIENFAHTAGFAVLLGLMTFVSLRDLWFPHR